MLLQMTFEKLGKAAFARRTPLSNVPANAEPPRKHNTASRLLELLRRSPGGAADAPSPAVLSAVRELENAHPQLAAPDLAQIPPKLQWPQLEFPWIDPTSGAVKSPRMDLPIARRMTNPIDPIGPQLLKFADALIKDFDTLFPAHPP
jgi:hypothetical protein